MFVCFVVRIEDVRGVPVAHRHDSVVVEDSDQPVQWDRQCVEALEMERMGRNLVIAVAAVVSLLTYLTTKVAAIHAIF